MRLFEWLTLVLLLTGCRDSTPDEPQASPATAADTSEALAPTPSEEPPKEAPAPVVEEESFELRARAAEDYVVGAEATFDIALTAKGGWHVNEEYPMTVEVRPPAAIQVKSDELKKEDAAEFGEEGARFEIPFSAAEAGDHPVEAHVDFAVCTPETCIPEERTLSFLLPVAATNP